ncbi:5-formyltetrahydrofolate cyclo-ligase [Roseibaca sp. Y0-43]|uniref:5-formyltetrahydrofolate cyclo-ligase n=1 Tax=Roseibaca sp. Y0-43 TaxID=2816854 RepID=UPI001D0C8BB9|nr:5-formyltetrahydrofolate cyclo-ligase [Roseibaca sp. Y0-43]MCC1480484.1 5-formyltetrahydrofolate cyclo-ligase [Roseibaca sp. Y0-43]
MSEDKSASRAAAAKRRAEAHEGNAQAAAQAACDRLTQVLQARFGASLGGRILAGYMPMRSEISPLPAMHAHPGPVCVPVIPALHSPLIFHRWTPDMPMVPGRFGARVPEQAEALVPQILIVPLLAYDARGYRLGYGGGFYDRTLAQLRAQGRVLAVGLAYVAQEQPEVPTESTDEKLDLIVTETGVLEIPR